MNTGFHFVIYPPFIRFKDRVKFFNTVLGFDAYKLVDIKFSAEKLVELNVFDPLLQLVCLDCIAKNGKKYYSEGVEPFDY